MVPSQSHEEPRAVGPRLRLVMLAVLASAGCVRGTEAIYGGPAVDAARPADQGALDRSVAADRGSADSTAADVTRPEEVGVDVRSPEDAGRDQGSVCASQRLVLSAAEDDGEFDGPGTLLPNGETGRILIGSWAGHLTWGYFRFALASPLRRGARISAARLALWGRPPERWNPLADALRVSAELTPDAAPVQATGDYPGGPAGRVTVNDAVRWPPSGGLYWALDDWNESEDLSSVLQEVVNTAEGLAQGAHVQIWVWGDTAASDAEVTTPAFGSSGYVAPTLTIDWCE